MHRRDMLAGGLALLLAKMTGVAGISALAACSREGEGTGPQYGAEPPLPGVAGYRLAVHPLHNPVKLMQAYQPLADALNKRLQSAHLTVEASRDYANFEDKYRAGKPEFLLPNPWQTLQAMQFGYRVIAMAGEADDFKGLIVVRKDGGVQDVADLKGKAVSYPSRTALAACIMPQYFLYKRGIDVSADIENRYVGSQESAIMNVHLRLTSAGATWPPPWRAFQKEHPQEADELEVRWETESLINNSVMVRRDVPAAVVKQVRTLLLGLDTSPSGKAILAGMETARFHPATDADYDVVRRYVDRFEREVRPVDE